MSGEESRDSQDREVPRSTPLKVQAMMQKATEDVYWNSVTDLENQTCELIRAIEVETDVEKFKFAISRWMQDFEQMTIAEREWDRCVNDSDKLAIHRIFEETRSRAVYARDRACNRLDELMASAGTDEVIPEYFTQQGAVADSGVNEEVVRLRSQVDHLQRELARSRSPSQSPTSRQTPLSQRFLEHSPLPREAEASRCQSMFSPPGSEAEEVIHQLTQALSKMNNRDNLPKTEPDVFRGDVLLFPIWWNTFKMLVERVTPDPLDKLVYLGKYTAGDAKDCIRGYLALVNDVTAYDRAKQKLHQRFGDRVKIAETFRSKLRNWPVIRRGDPAALRKFSDLLWQCHAAMLSIGFLSSLNHPEENFNLVKKLPPHLSDRWNRMVVDKVYSATGEAGGEAYPDFESFCKFVERESRIADGPCSSRPSERQEGSQQQHQSRYQSRDRRNAQSFFTESRQNQAGRQTPTFEPREYKCLHCSGKHSLDKCEVFLKQGYDKKKEIAVKNSLCFGCLRKGHGVATCRRKNPSLLGRPPPVPELKAEVNVNETSGAASAVSNKVITSEAPQSYSSMIVPVALTYHNAKIVTYALLDSQSDSCFVREDLITNLGAPYEDVELNLTTMGSRSRIHSKLVRGLQVRGLTETEILPLPPSFTRGIIPSSPGSIPKAEQVARWPHLAEVAESLIPYQKSWGIGILIGYNCARALLPVDVVPGKKDVEPFGIKTPLGWSVIGQVGELEEGVSRHEKYFFVTKAQEVSIDAVKSAFDIGFDEPDNSELKMSQEDVKFLKAMEEGFKLLSDGHIQLPLPLRDAELVIPNNRAMAELRLKSLRNKLFKNPEFCAKYVAFVQKMKANGYVERVRPEDEGKGRRWFLPHQGVQHPRKPDVVRVVHDGSAEYKGLSLNKMLLPGPDQNNLLAGVLMRFRLDNIGFTCDIEGMFLQVVVSPEYRDLLSFLWFEDDDPRKEVVVYRVCVHLFGATSSPACATYALKSLARLYKDEFSPEVTEFVQRYFYVDDGVRAVGDRNTAWNIMNGSRELCARGGFNLHKFMCNDVELFKKIPAEWRAKDLAPEALTDPEAPWYSLLGTNWSLWDDTFRFAVKSVDRCTTRRTMLSFLGSLYDPMGLISPVVLKGRIILQDLCKTGCSWDAQADAEAQKAWDNWMIELSGLSEIKVQRNVKKTARGDVKGILHLFSDASSVGYGVCAYLELKDAAGRTDTALMYAKSRVNPVKKVTIPRMELQAAVLAVKTKNMLVGELDSLALSYRYYTDSRVVLGYLQNAQKKFRLYVANRVQNILNHSDVKEWRYVNTKVNPADLTSRGVSPVELAASTIWWNGPQEAMHDENDAERYHVDKDDPEVARDVVSMPTQVYYNAYQEKIALLSDWNKIVATYAVWRRYFACLKAAAKGLDKPEYRKHVTIEEREEAIKYIVKGLQQEYFPDIYVRLSGVKYPKSAQECREREELMGDARRLRKLDPYMDADGLIRVGGHIRRSNLPLGWKHPYVLPSNDPITSALIRYHHEMVSHGSKNATITELRNAGFWILRWRRTVGKIVSSCVVCRKWKAQPMAQKMADLPEERLLETPPFTHVGVDMFGPFLVKEGRSVKKRWACIYTCLAVRAIHIEVCEDMTTSAFINSYRRLIARRGQVRTIRSDQGTNILGARAELSPGLDGLDHEVIRARMLKDGCDFVRFIPNPPHAPHRGGIWERMIRSVKQVLSIVLAQVGEQLNTDALHTFLLEAESIVNNRPLVVADYSDPDSPEPLTPAQILTLKKRGPLPPPGSFVEEDMYCRARWKRVQYVADEFWTRWKKEYLPTLQVRKKWCDAQENLKIGDVVLIKSLNTPRSKWPLARVKDVRTSRDGHVRSATVQTQDGTYQRPIQKLVFLFTPGEDLVDPEGTNRGQGGPSPRDGGSETR